MYFLSNYRRTPPLTITLFTGPCKIISVIFVLLHFSKWRTPRLCVQLAPCHPPAFLLKLVPLRFPNFSFFREEEAMDFGGIRFVAFFFILVLVLRTNSNVFFSFDLCRKGKTWVVHLSDGHTVFWVAGGALDVTYPTDTVALSCSAVVLSLRAVREVKWNIATTRVRSSCLR